MNRHPSNSVKNTFAYSFSSYSQLGKAFIMYGLQGVHFKIDFVSWWRSKKTQGEDTI